MRYKNQIKYTLQLVICVLLGLEVSILPNPYTTHLIIALTLYICLKHKIVQKIESSIESWLFDWKS